MEERLKALEEKLEALTIEYKIFEMYWAYERARATSETIKLPSMIERYVAFKEGEISGDQLVTELSSAVSDSILDSLSELLKVRASDSE